MEQLKQLPDVLTKNSASRKSALTMRGSTVRRTKIDDRRLRLQSISWCAGLPAGIRKRARSIFRHLLTIKSTSCCQNGAVYNYFILHLYKQTCFFGVGLSNAKSEQRTATYATQEDTEICGVLSNMCAKHTTNSGSFFHPISVFKAGKQQTLGFLKVLPLLGVLTQNLRQDAKKCRQHAQLLFAMGTT